MPNNEAKQEWTYWLMLGLSIFIIIFGVITICSPSIFWKFLDIILGFFLFAGGTSAVINAFKNKDSELVWLLGIGGFLLALLGIGLIFSWSQIVGTIMIWIFALWALVRGIMLIIFGINNRAQQSMRWGIVGLGCLLLVLAIAIIVDRGGARTIAGICIGISTVLDGISLLVFSLKMKNNPSLQTELVNQADQNEIAQGDVVITQTTVVTQVTSQPSDASQQPNEENPA